MTVGQFYLSWRARGFLGEGKSSPSPTGHTGAGKTLLFPAIGVFDDRSREC